MSNNTKSTGASILADGASVQRTGSITPDESIIGQECDTVQNGCSEGATEALGGAMVDHALTYASMGLAVFPLWPKSKDPACAHGFKDATTDAEAIKRNWGGSRSQCNIGIATGSASGHLVVIDIDMDEDEGKDGYASLREWELENKDLPETWSVITGRGGLHLYFRASSHMPCTTNSKLAVDIRGDGGYIIAPPSIHPNGSGYVWENDPEDFELAEVDDNVLAFMDYVYDKKKSKGRAQRFKANPEQKKGGRNTSLFKMGASMRSQGNNDHAVACAMRAYNDGFSEPLPSDEVERTIESVCSYEPGNAAVLTAEGKPKPAWRGKGDKFLHDVFTDWLIETRHARIIDGVPSVYNGQVYESGITPVKRAIAELDKSLTKNQRSEVLEQLLVVGENVKQANSSLIAFRNGILDISTMQLLDFSPELTIANQIPHNWNPKVDTFEAELFLNQLACGYEPTKINLEEAIGYCMYRSCSIRFVPICTGVGSNGKSTFVNVLRYIIGDENISSLDLETLGMRFMAGNVAGKLANLGDDINPEVKDKHILSVFKKLATGDKVFTDVKGMNGYEFRSYATLIFSCNGCPTFGDSSDGLMQRIYPIPFEADFSATNPDSGNVPNMEQRMSTETMAEAFIVLGVRALASMVERRHPTRNEKSDKEKLDVLYGSDSVRAWLAEVGLDGFSLENAVAAEIYANYKEWCADSNVSKFESKTGFNKKIYSLFGLKAGSRKVLTANGYKSMYCYVRKKTA